MGWFKDDRSSIVAVIACTALTIAPHLIPGFPLPKSEDFEYTTVASVLFVKQWLAGQHLNWVPFIGLGAPWPIPMGLGHSVLAPLLALLRPLTATAIIVGCHLLLSGAAIMALGRRLGIDRRVLPVCVLSLMMSPALEYLYSADAPTVFLTWTWLPVTFALVFFLLEPKPLLERCALALGLGVSGGLMLSEGHVGVVAIYLLGFAAFLICELRRAIRATPYFVIAAVVALMIAADQLMTLRHEAALFAADVPRAQQGLFRGYVGVLWGLFARPLFWPSLNEPLLSSFARMNMTVRTISFGAPFLLIVVWQGRQLWQRASTRPFLIAFWLCMLMLLAPKSSLPVAFSASWPLRDFVAIFGVLLAGVVLTDVAATRAARWPRRVLLVQAAVVVGGALPLLAGASVLRDRGIFSTQTYNRLIDVADPTPYVRALREAVGPADRVDNRFVASFDASRMMDVEMLVDQGAVNNVAIAHGFAEVSYIAKGLSFDSIQRSRLLPYGAVMGDHLVGFGNVDPPDDWTRDNQALLTLLGIRAVVVQAGEKPRAPELVPTTELPSRDGYRIAFYRNTVLLPRSFVVADAALDRALARRPGCVHDVLVCYDVSPVVEMARPAGIDTLLVANGFQIAAAASPAARSVLTTFMYRPNWRAADRQGRPVAVANWHGLIRVELPPGETAVIVRFEEPLKGVLRKARLAALVAVPVVLGVMVLTIALLRRRGEKV